MSSKAHKDQKQQDAEAEVLLFKERLGPFVVAAETTRMPIVFTNAKKPDNPIIFVNDAFLRLTGYNRDEVLAQSFSFLLAEGTDHGDLADIDAAFAGHEYEPEIHYARRDGSEFWATIFVCPVTDESGQVVQYFVSMVDCSKHRKAQNHAAMLIDELNHRVKNTLATVQSIVTQAVRNAIDPQIVRESIETRIAALSRSHDLLGREKWGGAGLHDLIHEALAPFRVTEGAVERFTTEGDNIRLPPKAALALGIAFNELATNAVKYGALSNETGTIAIKWTMETKPDGVWLSINWREQGGPTVMIPERKGFGSRVIEQGLAHELNGIVELSYECEGIVCTIDVPTSHAVLDG